MHYFLGIEATTTPSGCIHLSQQKYIHDLLTKAGMASAKPMPTPMLSSLKLSAHGSAKFDDPSLYRSVVGALQYVTITRLDLSYAVNKVCQFMHTPLVEHWKVVKRILHYLSGTSNRGLLFRPCKDLRLWAFSDSDWGSDTNDRKSTSGYCIFLGPNLVSWSCKKQNVVSKSSNEAEFRSMAAALADLTWIQNLLIELHQPCTLPPSLFCDNISAVHLSANPILHSRTKHFELDLYFVRDRVIKKQVHVTYISSSEQVADVLTKPLSAQSFLKFRDKLKVLPAPVFEGG